MKTRVNAIVTVLLSSLLVGAGCANISTKGPDPQPTGEVISDSWVTTKLKSEQVKGVSGVVTADQIAQAQTSANLVQTQSDSDAEFGRRSLPFFPVFAIRPW